MKPIVVSTDRPSRIAASDAPAPRWQVTIRSSSTGRPSISAARREAYACDRPWKPYLRSAQRFRHSGGMAYVVAAAGIPAWKAVSKQATAGTSGSTAFTAASAASDLGWWSGARSVSARRFASTAASRRTGPL